MDRRSTVLYAVTLGILVLLFVGFVSFMDRVGFFNFSTTTTESGAKIIVAALAVVGAFAGAVASIIGVILKFSIDQQTAALQTEAEQRLKLEAAVRALQLFSTSSGGLSPAIQRDGALFMLMSFAQHDLTLQLVGELLSKGEVSAGVAANIIDEAIRRADDDAKETAITVFHDNAARMVTQFGTDVPSALANWIPGLPDYVREWGAYALGRVMCARPLAEWTSRKFLFNAYSVIAALSLAWIDEKTDRLKKDIGAILHQLLVAFPETNRLFHPRRVIDANALRAETAQAAPTSVSAQDVVNELIQWAAAGPGETAA